MTLIFNDDNFEDDVCCISAIFGVIGYIAGYLMGVVAMVMRWY